jgi:hypothetical protein
MATAIRGAVITRQDQAFIVYLPKCEKCGATEPGEVTRLQLTPGGMDTSNYLCRTCGNYQAVEFRG